MFGFGRGVFKKFLFQIIKIGVGDKEISYVYNKKNFKLFPLRNSTDSKMIVSSRIIDSEELSTLKNIPKKLNSTFLDIGANIGYYSISVSKYGFKNIFCFEPIPRVIKQLDKNIKINQLESLIEIVPMGLGEKNETKIIYEDLENFGNSSLINQNNKKIKHNIKVINLYDFIYERKIKDIDAIKIDVEGYEDRVLCKYIEKINHSELPKIIILEHSNSHLWKEDLISLLENRKYFRSHKLRGNSIYQKN